MRSPLMNHVLAVVSAFWLVALGTSRLAAGENYALLVAVGDYDLKELRPLKFTRSDVIAFHAALVESGFPPKNIVLMHDDVETLSAHYRRLGGGQKPKDYLPEGGKIRKELELLLGRLRADDSVVVAFSGHGVQFKGEKKSYFCPADAKLEQKDSLIGFDEVFAALKECDAGRKLFLVDACQNDPQSEIGKSRKTIDLDSVTRPQTEAVPEGIIALFSCRAGQKSFELPELGHGVFFYHLLDGWKGNADLNGDGKLSYQEIAMHTEKKTAEFAAVKLKVLQTPQLKTDFSGQWILRELEKPNLPPPLFDAKNGKTAAEAKASQEAWAKHLKTSVEVENSIGMKLRLIPAGEYLRGSTDADIERMLKEDSNLKREYFADERPQQRVRITKPFYLGRTEVTQAEWTTVVGTNPSYFSKTGGSGKVSGDTSRYPVEGVSWYDAVEYCLKLSEKDGQPPYYRLQNIERKDGAIRKADVTVLGGKGYRLPTEAEWEYAARAGTTTRFHFGEVNNGKEANIDGNRPLGTLMKGPTLERTTAVGSYAENAFDLVDMCGNVWEWCDDWYGRYSFADPDSAVGKILQFSPEMDPRSPFGGALHVRRGGAWDTGAAFARSATRYYGTLKLVGADIGFRIARTP